MNLNDSVMLVTGGAHRVGKAIALALAGEGARVAFTYHASEAAAHQTAAELQAQSGAALALRCDQTQPEQISAAVAAVVERFGRIDGLVNSASIMPETPFFDTTPADWDAALAVNTRGPFFFTQAAARAMLAQDGGGSVVNILDESAFAPTRGCIQHGISKSGLWMLTRSCALALAPRIRVNAVTPGAVLIPQGWSEERWQRLAQRIPLRRLGTAEDVARAVVFLMREDYLTGQSIGVDGGSLLAR